MFESLVNDDNQYRITPNERPCKRFKVEIEIKITSFTITVSPDHVMSITLRPASRLAVLGNGGKDRLDREKRVEIGRWEPKKTHTHISKGSSRRLDLEI
jgi:hypothetical protein